MKIKIEKIIEEEITSPKNDDSRGSGLYAIPFKLNEVPSYEWVEIFIRKWNHPSSFSSMHRPGIASVRGNKIILGKTTIEEVEKYHMKTLNLAVEEANQILNSYIVKQSMVDDEEKKKGLEHKNHVKSIVDRIKFE